MNRKTIKKTALGSTGISVTRMGLGLAALGRPGYINLGHKTDLKTDYDVSVMEDRAHKILDRAWQLGVRYFDAARSYGNAEKFLSSWLHSRRVAPGEVTVGSKWGYSYTADWKINVQVHEVKEHSPALLEKQWGESRSHLGDWLKLYQIHSATLDSGVLDNAAVLTRLSRLKSENLAIGLSLSGTMQSETLKKAMGIEIDGRRLFDTVQATWNILETSAGKVLQQAAEQGMGVIIKEAVANGRLTERNQEANFLYRKRCLTEIAAAHNVSIDALSLAYVLQQPWVHIVLSGAATTRQLESNLQALQFPDLPEIDIAENSKEYWQKRSDLPWN